MDGEDGTAPRVDDGQLHRVIREAGDTWSAAAASAKYTES